MTGRGLAIIGAIALLLAVVLGLGSLSLTAYLWVGDWPAEARETIDYLRSVAATEQLPPEPLLGNPRGRSHRSLSGRWDALVDPGAFPLAELAGLVPRDVKPKSPSDLVEFAYDPDSRLEVPGDWNSQHPRLFWYRGVVWYRRSFDVTPKPDRRLFLYFGAANYQASVYLNKRRIGTHRGGFTPFNFDITDAVQPGENLLVVRVDNESGPGDVPTRSTDWFNYGGLTRDVLLIETPTAFLRSYWVRLAPERFDRIEIDVQVDGAAGPLPVSIELPELGLQAVGNTDAKGHARLQIDAAPPLWSPEQPTLHTLTLRAGDDAIRDEIGFRHFQARGRDLLLNGQTVYLRGISLHEEAPRGRGRAQGEADARVLLGWAQELGANFVRLAHYPHDEATLRLADRLGLLAWSEIPVYWNVAFDRPETLELARRQLGEMIERDRNRASVVLWSIGNETPISDARNAFMRALAEHARALDPSRPVTAALLSGPSFLAKYLALAGLATATGLGPDEWTLPIADPLGEIVDVPALNEYFGWYYSMALSAGTPLESREVRAAVLENLPRIRLELPVEKPLIVSELGAGAKAGWRAPRETLTVFSEDYQARVYEQQIEMLRRQPHVRGVSPWALTDFRSAMRLLPGVQDHWNRKGLISDAGQKKLAFGVLRDFYAELAESGAAPAARR